MPRCRRCSAKAWLAGASADPGASDMAVEPPLGPVRAPGRQHQGALSFCYSTESGGRLWTSGFESHLLCGPRMSPDSSKPFPSAQQGFRPQEVPVPMGDFRKELSASWPAPRTVEGSGRFSSPLRAAGELRQNTGWKHGRHFRRMRMVVVDVPTGVRNRRQVRT